MLIIDDVMDVIYASREFERCTGFTEEEVIGKKWYNVIHKDDKEIIIKYLKNRIDEGKETFKHDIKIVKRHGEQISASIEVSSIPGTEMSIVWMKELQERETSQEIYDQSEILRLSYENASEGLISFNEKGTVTNINRRMITLLDLPREEIIGLHFTQVFEMLGIELLEVSEDYHDIIKDLQVTSMDEWKLTNLRCNDYVLEVSSILLLKEEEVVGFTLSAHDITKKKKEEEKLKENEKRLKEINELGKIAGWEYDILHEKMTLSDEVYTLMKRDTDLRPPSNEEVSNYTQYIKKKLQEIVERYITGDIEEEYYFHYPLNKTIWYKTTMKRENDRYGRMTKVKGIIKEARERNKYEDIKKMMHTISAAIDEIGDFKKLMKLINQEIKSALAIRNSYIITYDREQNTIQIPPFKDEDSITDLKEPGNTLIEYVIQRGRTLQAVEGIPFNLKDKSTITIEGEKSIWIGIPLKHDSEVIGVFLVKDCYSTQEYSKGKIELLEYVSCEISKAVGLHQYRLQIERVFKDKIIMNQELHHRVNNNLQIIIALLNLQCHSIKTKSDAIKGYKESQDRIVAMAMIYEQLHESEHLSKINIAKYVTSISSHLKKNYDKTNKVRIEYDIENIPLNIDRLVKLGLILNELVTNAIKYAFKEKDEGTITIVIKEDKEYYVFIVEDDGIGISDKININNPKTLGLMLVSMLTKQMGWSKSVLTEKGTKFMCKTNLDVQHTM